MSDLRAARFTRESTKDQNDRHGPEAQREHQDRAVERLGATDTGIHWQVAHSGLSVDQTLEWADMLSRAGTDYDVLIVAYTSRLARRVKSQIAAVEALHAAGASVYFCDERISTAEARDWDNWMREAVEAESYSRRLARRVSEAYEAKWRKGLPGGNPPYGYNPDWTVDPIPAARVQTLFSEYEVGNVSETTLAERHGIKSEAVKEILRNRTYTGMAGRKGEWIKGAFDQIIDDAQLNDAHASGPIASEQVDPLRKNLRCSKEDSGARAGHQFAWMVAMESGSGRSCTRHLAHRSDQPSGVRPGITQSHLSKPSARWNSPKQK